MQAQNFKEKFINDIRKDLKIEKYENKNYFTSFEDLDSNIFKNIIDNNEDCLENPNNIYIKCTLKKNKITNNFSKIVKFKRKKENNKYEKAIVNVKIPENIQDQQKIVVYGEGNRTKGIVGNLIIDITIR